MFLADSHTHSRCSIDGHSSISEMAGAAVSKGISILTITDHVDLDYFQTGKLDGYCFENWIDIQEDFCEANLMWRDRLTLLLGLELGEASHHPDFAHEISNTPGIDYVIGSLHALRHTPDFYCLEYTSEAMCRDLMDKYLQEHLELVKSPDIDVIGHLGYTIRYMKRAGYTMSYDDYGDRLDEIFKAAVSNGVGFELNTSGLRQDLGSTIPTIKQIQQYRSCGGEIVTVGSDAHFAKDVGAGIAEGYEYLRTAGFKYVTVFKSRKPEFIKL